MALLLASLLTVLATGVSAQFFTNVQTVGILGLNHSEEYSWVSELPKGVFPNDLENPQFASLKCDTGNKGVQGLSFDRCVALCSLMSTCKVVAYISSGNEFNSECFAYAPFNNTLNANASDPVAIPFNKNQTAYVGVKFDFLGKDNYKTLLWANATAAGNIKKFPPPLTVSPFDCNGTTDTGVPGLDIEECINVCLAIPECLMMKFYPATADASSQCFQYRTIADELLGSGLRPAAGVTSEFVEYDTDKKAYLGINLARLLANTS